MSRALLDVNVLVALLDGDHVDHALAWSWFDAQGSRGWASCAITENGFVRVISQPRYPSPIPVAQAVGLLRDACAGSDHEFWPCGVSVLDSGAMDGSRLHGPRQVTDAYLLALAASHDGRFATFDRGIPVSAVPSAGPEHLVLL